MHGSRFYNLNVLPLGTRSALNVTRMIKLNG